MPLPPKRTRAHCRIPGFVSEERAPPFSCVSFPPFGERGPAVRRALENTGDAPRQACFGVEGE